MTEVTQIAAANMRKLVFTLTCLRWKLDDGMRGGLRNLVGIELSEGGRHVSLRNRKVFQNAWTLTSWLQQQPERSLALTVMLLQQHPAFLAPVLISSQLKGYPEIKRYPRVSIT